MVIAMCSKAQNLNFANNNYEMLYFTDEDEDYTISKYDIKVNLNKNFFGDLSFKWCKINCYSLNSAKSIRPKNIC